MRFLMILMISLLPLLLAAQDQSPTFRGGVTDVRLDVGVNEGNRILPDLREKDFVVFDESAAQPIVSFAQESVPLDLAFLLDVSGSMQRSLKQLAQIASYALSRLRPNDRVTVLAFSREVRVEQELTADKDKVGTAIARAADSNPIGEGTRINESIVRASELLVEMDKTPAAGLPRRRAVLIVTDNMGYSPQFPETIVLRKLLDANMLLYGLVVPHKPYRPSRRFRFPFQDEEGQVPDNIFYLAKETGGDAMLANKQKQNLSEILLDLRSRYTIVYHAPAAPAGTFRHVRVDLAETTRRSHPGAIVRTRDGYYVNRE